MTALADGAAAGAAGAAGLVRDAERAIPGTAPAAPVGLATFAAVVRDRA